MAGPVQVPAAEADPATGGAGAGQLEFGWLVDCPDCCDVVDGPAPLAEAEQAAGEHDDRLHAGALTVDVRPDLDGAA